MAIPYNVMYLANAVSAPGTLTGVFLPPARQGKSFQSITTGTCSVTIQVSNDNINWIDYLQMTDNDGFNDSISYAFYRAVISAVSGTVTVLVGF